MNYSEEILSRFDRYTSGEMSSGEQKDFELALKENDSLRQDFEDYQQMNQGLRAFAYQQMSEKISNWESEIAVESQTKVIPFKKWYMVAATILLLIVAAFSWWKFGLQESTGDLYASYYQPYPDILTSRGSGERDLNEALFSYEAGNYDVAIEKFDQILADDQNNSELRFYLGQAYLANNEVNNAQIIFTSLLTEKSFALSDANQWYLALAYLKSGNIESTKEILLRINSDTNHTYKEKSKQLLDRLN